MVTLTAEFRGLVAVVQTVVVTIALPTFLDAAVVLAGKLSRLALGGREVGRVAWRGGGEQGTGRVEVRR